MAQAQAQAQAQAAAKTRKMKNAGIARKWDPPVQVLRAGEVLAAPVSPKVRAGVMRALAQLPGIRQLGMVTDPLGRRGIAIGTDGSAKSGTLAREELIFDEKTGAYLGEQQVLVTPGGKYRGQAPGFVISYNLMRSSGWTDTKPAPPVTLPFR